MKKYIITLCCFFSLQLIHAQDFINRDRAEIKTLKTLEKDFENWAADKELSEEKGWKWYARWLNEQAIRADGNGDFADQSPLFQAANEKLAAQRTSIESRNPSWIPAGPNDYPEIVTSYIIRGMGRINCITFHPTDSSTFWVGVAQGGIWKTTNGGESWMPLDNGLPILRISDIAINPNNPDEMYASVGDYAYLGISLELDNRKRHTHYGMGVYKSTNGGQSWEATGLTFEQDTRQLSLTRRVFVNHEDGQKLIAAGIFGIRTSDDGGVSWQSVNDRVIRDIERDPNNPNVLYAATATIRNIEDGQTNILKSTDFGRTWEVLNVGFPPNESIYRVELAIAPSNPDYIYAIAVNSRGGLYGLYRTTDGGTTWDLRSTSPNILHWSGGRSGGGQGSYDLAIVVDANDPDKIYTGGINLWGSEDGGTTWRMASYWVGGTDRKSIHADQHFLAQNILDNKIYACNDGGVSRTDKIVLADASAPNNLNDYKFQTNWEDIAGGMQISSFYRIGLSRKNPGDFIVGAQDNSSWLKKEGNWTAIIGGDGMEGLIHPENPDIIYGSSQYGNIAKSIDGGNSFFSVSGNINDNNEASAWTTPFMLNPNDPEELYVAYVNVYKSRNGGNSFQRISDFPINGQAASSLAISEANTDYMYVAHRIVHSLDAPSRMWRTFNGGENWDEITAGLPNELFFTYVAADDDNPELVWVTVGGFSDGQKVFRSDDGGDSWQNISYNLPNVPVNCIVQDPNSLSNAVYVGTDIGVFYSNDNMQTWDLYSEGLPNVIVSELEILEEEEKIYAATFGRGVWEGNTVVDAVNVENVDLKTLTIEVSPNPNDGRFQLNIEQLPVNQVFGIEIVDVMGRKIYNKSYPSGTTNWNETFDLDLAYGLYFLSVNIGKQRRVVRFIVD